ncbi:alpha/beta hydrolase [Streptomyces sp. ME19-01-6]|nr:alpha/beta hydrolase [Streptomyces sp. ME19-01-6]MDX3229929.1 alpha/beta hydrolase [Streptomyces sp. ME19-01-6]
MCTAVRTSATPTCCGSPTRSARWWSRWTTGSPEHPFPAGLEDSYAALVWTAGHAAELDIDPARLAIGGDSAGGGLATALALMARDRGGPALCFQYLGVPMLDDRMETASMRVFTDTPVWNRPIAEICWSHYLGGEGRRGGPEVPEYAAPARVADLSGLPPAFVYVCEFDPLRDEGMSYAQRLVQAGVTTELHLYPGTFHGSAGLPWRGNQPGDARRRAGRPPARTARALGGAAALFTVAE